MTRPRLAKTSVASLNLWYEDAYFIILQLTNLYNISPLLDMTLIATLSSKAGIFSSTGGILKSDGTTQSARLAKVMCA